MRSKYYVIESTFNLVSNRSTGLPQLLSWIPLIGHDIKLARHGADVKWVRRKSDTKVMVFHRGAHSCREGDGEVLHERGEEEEKHHPGQVLSETQPSTYEVGKNKIKKLREDVSFSTDFVR